MKLKNWVIEFIWSGVWVWLRNENAPNKCWNTEILIYKGKNPFINYSFTLQVKISFYFFSVCSTLFWNTFPLFCLFCSLSLSFISVRLYVCLFSYKCMYLFVTFFNSNNNIRKKHFCQIDKDTFSFFSFSFRIYAISTIA